MLFKVLKNGQELTWLTMNDVSEAAAWVLEDMTCADNYDNTIVGLLPVVVGYRLWTLFAVKEDGALVPTGYQLEEM